MCGERVREIGDLDRVAGEVAGRVHSSGRPVARVVGARQEAPPRAWLDEASSHQPVSAAGGLDGLSWAPVDACTLPTAEQPLRVAEFAELFAASLRGVERVSPTRLRLELDAAAEAAARDLAARESGCCGFFSFTFGPAGADTVGMEVGVPDDRSEVLDGLAAQATAARAT